MKYIVGPVCSSHSKEEVPRRWDDEFEMDAVLKCQRSPIYFGEDKIDMEIRDRATVDCLAISVLSKVFFSCSWQACWCSSGHLIRVTSGKGDPQAHEKIPTNKVVPHLFYSNYLKVVHELAQIIN